MAVVVCIDLIIILFALQVHSSVGLSVSPFIHSFRYRVFELQLSTLWQSYFVRPFDLFSSSWDWGFSALFSVVVVFFFWKMRWKVQFGIFLFGSFRKEIVVAFLPLNYMDTVQRAPLQFPGISLDGRWSLRIRPQRLGIVHPREVWFFKVNFYAHKLNVDRLIASPRLPLGGISRIELFWLLMWFSWQWMMMVVVVVVWAGKVW